MADDFSISIQDASSENEDGIPSIHVNNSFLERFLTFRITNTSNTDKMLYLFSTKWQFRHILKETKALVHLLVTTR